ncbi:YdeI/OmpD-associated family protein [Aeromicrobium ginsengisoli]|uniref:Bacteriocin-protection protein n=1 Tax=Aeromicrobium ginsengisoli TaxID=363867 RepID=A0A5M4FIW3_9ACTN|nr:YdeI/OmpD-associated family protein [Aeromicrobium ginsengisoli]KAA1400040.1 bacteriocin-protection protein [Aeromicrobium ginsengisoli]
MADEPVPIRFADVAEAEAWYDSHHADTDRAWFVIAKKGSRLSTPTLAELLDLALAFGWIDGQRRSLDDEAYLQSYGPRRPQSPWSQINRDKVAALTAAGRMRPAGLAEVERAQQDGRWDAATASPSTAEVPEDFLAALEANPAAKAFFATLNKRNTFAVYYQLHHAKRPETRARRIEKFVSMFERGETLH